MPPFLFAFAVEADVNITLDHVSKLLISWIFSPVS